MAKFDPDAYLAKKPASKGFDPDAYLAAGAPAAPVTPPGQIPVDNRVQAPAAVSAEVPLGRRAMQALGDVGAGMIRGAGSIGATILAPVDIAKDALSGKGLSLESNRQRRQDMTDALRMLGADTDSTAFAGGRFASEVAGTMGAGGALAKAAAPLAKVAPQFVAALPSAGFAGGSLPTRLAAGATVGGVSAGAVNPEDITTGATLGAGLAGVAPGASRLVSKIADFGNAKVRAAQIARDAAGPDLPALRNALAAAQGQNVTAGQATADVISPTWQALGDRALRLDPRFTNKLAATQEAEAVNALARAAGGDTAAATRTAVAGEKTALNAVTTPLREAAIKAADAATLQPLKSDAVTQELGKILGKSEYAGNDIMRGAVKNVADEIAAWTNKNTGVIPGDALDAIRKNAVNAAVAKLRPGMDATSQKNAASGVLSQIKPLIDDAIEAAGGPGYKQYLATHAAGMQKIAEQKLMGEGLSLWKTNKDQFVKMVQNESPDVVEKILGPGKYDIARDLASSHMTVLRDQAAKALRDKAVATQVTEGQEALKNLLLQDMSKIRLPSYLSVITSTTNKALDTLERALGRRTMAQLTEAMKSPKGASDLLSTLPANERVKILAVLNDPKTWGSTGQAVRSGVNALAVSDEPTE
jgi:hypothetical protein